MKKPYYADHLVCYALACKLVFNERIVELGCGEGYGAQMLSIFAKDYVGFDFSERYISLAKGKQLHCIHDFRRLDLETELDQLVKGDFYVAFEILEHINNPKEVLQKIHDWGAGIIFSVPHNDAHPYHKRVYQSLDDVATIVPDGMEVKWCSLSGGVIELGEPSEPDRYIGIVKRRVI